MPLQRWMQHDLNGMLMERVTDANSYAMTHFDPGRVRDLLTGDGWDAKRWAGVAWSLLCLEIWWDHYHRNILTAALDRDHRPASVQASA